MAYECKVFAFGDSHSLYEPLRGGWLFYAKLHHWDETSIVELGVFNEEQRQQYRTTEYLDQSKATTISELFVVAREVLLCRMPVDLTKELFAIEH